MPSSLSDRIARLERCSQFPPEARLFLERAYAHARRTYCSFGEAAKFVAGKVGDQELEILAEQFERIVFGSDTAARDAAKQEAFAEYSLQSAQRARSSNLESMTGARI
jgi:hypothetical protein